MSSPAQKIFKKIVVHNKLLSEARANALLDETPDPEHLIKRLVKAGKLPDKVGQQLLGLYRKQVEKIVLDSLINGSDEPDPAAGSEESAAASQTGAPQTTSPPTDDTESNGAEEPAAAEPEKPRPVKVPKIKDIGDGGKDFILRLLKEARDAGASDLHVKPEMPAVVRIAASLQNVEMPELQPEVCERALLSLLDDVQRDVFLKHNDLDFCYDGGPSLGRFRTNYLREHRGVDAVFRPIADRVPVFEELGLPDTVRKFTENRVGIVLVTGPKGCGKTTTLAAMIDVVNSTRKEHIITVEDPIEFVQPCKQGHVNQRQVGPHTKSFSNALRAALREAPDVIMVGEMRDLETTSLAITAAETGHLVLATLHTPDAIRTIGRVLDVFPPKEQGQIRAMISESLRGICSQLLVPSKDGTSMALVYEILVNTTAIGHLIREQRVHQIRGLMQAGKHLDMVLMDECLVNLAKEGRISKETVLSHGEDMKYIATELARMAD